MRRHAEIALHTAEGAWNALLAARNAARETLHLADSLSIDPREAQAIREATRRHVGQVEAALVAVDQALRSAKEVNQAVDRAEISAFGLPVLHAQAGA